MAIITTLQKGLFINSGKSFRIEETLENVLLQFTDRRKSSALQGCREQRVQIITMRVRTIKKGEEDRKSMRRRVPKQVAADGMR